jgi:hypothetical protein
MQNPKDLLLLLLLFCSLIVGCKKKEDKDPVPAAPKPCKINGYTDSANTKSVKYSFEFENDQIKSIKGSDGFERNFSRNGNYILVSTKKANGQEQFDSVILNNDKSLISSIHTKSGANPYFSSMYMHYTTAGNISFVTSTSDTIFTCEWKDGNLVKEDFGNYTFEYDYHPDKKLVDGDFTSFSQFTQYGAVYTKNKNLVKSRRQVSTIMITYVYDYSFDGEKIKNIWLKFSDEESIPPTPVNTINYTYLCP